MSRFTYIRAGNWTQIHIENPDICIVTVNEAFIWKTDQKILKTLKKEV